MVYALIALGYSLVYGILELINFAHGDVFMLGGMMTVTCVGWFGLRRDSGNVARLDRPDAGDHGARSPGAERHDRDDRLPAAAQRAPARAADHRDRRLVHPPERRPASGRGRRRSRSATTSCRTAKIFTIGEADFGWNQLIVFVVTIPTLLALV